MPLRRSSDVVVLGAVVALVAIAIGAVTAVLLSGGNLERSTPLISLIMLMVAPTVAALVSAHSAAKATDASNQVNRKLDGALGAIEEKRGTRTPNGGNGENQS